MSRFWRSGARPALICVGWGILFALSVGGCKERRGSGGASTASLDAPTASLDAAPTASLDAPTASLDAAPTTSLDAPTASLDAAPPPPPALWATWPMPNSRLPGLPNPQSYDTRTPGVALDEVTGLMWQRSVSSGLQTFVGAQRECGGLSLAGYDDWRLPSRIELVSILDGTRTQPSVDVKAFPDTPSHWFWTSSPAVDEPDSAWYVYFYFGYPKTEEKRNRFSVRCVRTATAHPLVQPRYDVQADTVRDVATGLTWERAVPSGKFTFEAARAYCAQRVLGREKHWRVPTLPELLTLIDERADAPMIDRAAFPGTPSEQFWTSTNFSGGHLEGWYVYFSHGAALYDLVSSPYRVRCVL